MNPPGARFCEMGCGPLPEVVAEAEPAPAAQAAAQASVVHPRMALTLPRVFHEGESECLAVAVGFDADVFENVRVEIRNGNLLLGSAERSHPGLSCVLQLDVKGMLPGSKLLNVELACRRREAAEEEVYEATLQVKVLSNSRQRTPIVINQKIDVNGTGSDFSGMKIGGINLPVNLDGDDDDFASEIGGSAEQPISIQGYANDFSGAKVGGVNAPKPAAGRSTTLSVPLTLVFARSPRRLLLESDGEIVQLFSMEQLTFGRGRGNEVVLRVFDSDEYADDAASKRISGTHFTMKYSGSAFEIRDGGEKASSNGTYIEEDRLGWGKTRTLKHGRYTVRLGERMNDFELELEFAADKLQGSALGCVIRRRDGARRRTMWVARRLKLENGASLEWDGAKYVLVDKQCTRNLVPGESVNLGGKVWRVSPFRATWIKDDEKF